MPRNKRTLTCFSCMGRGWHHKGFGFPEVCRECEGKGLRKLTGPTKAATRATARDGVFVRESL